VERLVIGDAWAILASEPPGPHAADTLLSRLLSAAAGEVDAGGGGARGGGGALGGARLSHDRWGRPALIDPLTGDEGRVHVSFSHRTCRTWAAVAIDGRIGLDVSSEGDFAGSYPFRRVFTDGEIERALPLHGGRLASAAARLWACKEAAAKALGRGFHEIDYREVEVIDRIPAPGLLFAVRARAAMLVVLARREGGLWLAVATDAQERRQGH
jgi:phosphopantetheinyl transferase (holo-ACP synthase)